jgi:hypothetical protein
LTPTEGGMAAPFYGKCDLLRALTTAYVLKLASLCERDKLANLRTRLFSDRTIPVLSLSAPS